MRQLIRATCAAAVLLCVPGLSEAKEFKVTIRFVPKDSAHPKAKCVGVTSSPVLAVRTGDTIKWKLKKDDDQPCESFDPEQVTLHFESDQIVSGDGIKGSQDVKGHRGGLFSAHSADATVIVKNSGSHKYDVMVEAEIAADPELEVTGGVKKP